MLGYCDIGSLKDIKDKTELFNAVKKRMPEVKLVSGKAVQEEMTKRGLGLMDVAAKIEVDAGGLSKRLTTGFALPYNSLTFLSHTMLHKSCQEVFLGYYTPTILPKDLSLIIEAMEDSEIEEIGKNLIEKLSKDKKYKERGWKIEEPEIVKERLSEFAEDRGLHLRSVFDDVKGSIYTGIQKMIDNLGAAPNLTTLTFYILALGTSLDYFTSLDYTGISLGTKNSVKLYGSSKEIKDKKVLTFISEYLYLDKEDKDRIFGEVIGHMLKKQ
jgi:hypothetical protein